MDKKSVTDLTSFQTFIKENNYVIVKVSADWCGPCKRIESDVSKMCETLNDTIKYITLDVNEHDEICDFYDVSRVPTFLNFIKSEKTDVHVGANLEKIQAFFDKTTTHASF